jgi:hypothetical protein
MATKQSNNNSPQPVPLQAKSPRKVSDDLSASYVTKTGKSQLGADFQPCRFSVICGRGKDSYDHVGNHHFRELASMFVARYSRAGTKTDKSEIVSEMVNMIHQAGGTFCKLEKGAWIKVEGCYAREKASALLREMVIQTQQKRRSSPAKSKMTKTKMTKKTKAKPARPNVQKQDAAPPSIQAHNDQKLVQNSSTTTGHSDDSFTPTTRAQQCSEHQFLVLEDSTAAFQEQHSDDSSMSTWSLWGDVALELDDNSLDDGDDFFDHVMVFENDDDFSGIFRMNDATRVTPMMSSSGVAAAESCIVLFHPADNMMSV